MHGIAILDAKLVDLPDVVKAPADIAVGAQNFLASGYRAVTIMPMMRGATAIVALSVVRLAPGPLSDEQLAVLKTFADQAVIAIENTRLLNELRQRIDDLERLAPAANRHRRRAKGNQPLHLRSQGHAGYAGQIGRTSL